MLSESRQTLAPKIVIILNAYSKCSFQELGSCEPSQVVTDNTKAGPASIDVWFVDELSSSLFRQGHGVIVEVRGSNKIWAFRMTEEDRKGQSQTSNRKSYRCTPRATHQTESHFFK